MINKSESQIDKLLNAKNERKESVFVIENVLNQQIENKRENDIKLQKQISEDFQIESDKTKHSSNNFDFSKFSIDIMKNKKQTDPSFSYMNDIVSNTIKMHRNNTY